MPRKVFVRRMRPNKQTTSIIYIIIGIIIIIRPDIAAFLIGFYFVLIGALGLLG